MSSLSLSLVRYRAYGAMVLTGLVALSIGTGTARSQLIPSANGAQSFLAAGEALAASGTRDITIGGVSSASGGYDASGVVYVTNGAAATTVTAQYLINGVEGPAFSFALAANAARTLAVPQQFTGQASNVPVVLRITNGAGGGVTLGSGTGLTLTGYANNGGTATSPLQGSSNLGADVSGTAPVTITVNNSGGTAATGLYSLNSAITIINNNATAQAISGRYTVDGTPTGPTISMTLPGGAGTASTLMALPTVMNLSGGTTHNIGFTVTDTGGLGITVKAGSTVNVTPYTNNAGTPSAVAATPSVNFTPAGGNPISLGVGGTSLTLGSVTVPAATAGTNVTFWDANIMLSLRNNVNTASTILAQYTIGGTPTGQIYTLNLAGVQGAVGTFYMPQQFTTLTAGQALGVQLSTPLTSLDAFLDASAITLVGHQQVPTVAVPEPASMSMAAMACVAFGAAAYRKRRSAKVPA